MNVNIKETAKDLLSKELKENEEEQELMELARKLCDLKKTTNDLEIGNTSLERKINDLKAESAKMMSEVSVYDKLINVTKDKIKDELAHMGKEKQQLEEVQSEVWADMEKFVEAPMPDFEEDPALQKSDEDFDAELRTMELEILKLAGEVEAMQSTDSMLKEKIAEIERMKQEQEQGHFD